MTQSSTQEPDHIRGIVISPGRVDPPYLIDRRKGGSETDWLRMRWMVLVVLFVVTGAFGLPLLWRSDSFGTTAKFVWSVIVIVYTAALFFAAFWVIRTSLSQAFPPS